MQARGIIGLSILAAATLWASAGFGEEMDCQAKYRSSSQFTGESPGSLATTKDMPCRLTRHIGGIPKGRPSGRAGAIMVVQQPRNGSVAVVGRASLIFTPKPGFVGSDTMLVRMGYAGGTGGLVRFAITVQ